jgi:Tfp pilus assembly protein PilX
MKTFKSLHNERGFVLLIVYAVAIFVTVFSVTLFARHRAAIQATERYQNRILAFNAAESGIDFALRELATDSALRSQTATGPYTSPYTPVQENQFQFIISPVTDQSSLRRIDSKGCAPNCTSTSRAYQTSDITVYCQITASAPPTSLFQYGVYAGTSISMSGNSAFDSYNSNYGAYGGSNKSSEGGMAANSAQAGGISLNGNAKVNGSVYVAPAGDPNAVVSVNHATITGARSNLPEDWSAPAPATTPETHTDITLNVSGNNTVTLAAGTYHASSISISGNAKIVTTGAVVIYVDGPVNLSGNGIVVPNNHPANLLLYSTGSANVSISGNGSFYGGIYAPNSAVTATGNGDVFGAVISNTYTQSGNSATHFDLALKDLTVTDPNQTQITRIKAWQELNSLAWGTGQTI